MATVTLARWTIVSVMAAASAGADPGAFAQQVAAGGYRQVPSREPSPQGQRIDARDGDLIVVEGDARVKIVRRRQATVRAIFNATDRWLVLLVDQASSRGESPDGLVDSTYTFNSVTGNWPLQERWEGYALVENYSLAERGLQQGIGLLVPGGLVQLLSTADQQLFQDPQALAVLSYRGAGAGGGGRESFDAAERRQVGVAMQNAQAQPRLPVGARSPSISLGMEAGIVGGTMTSSWEAKEVSGPFRVGGAIVTPRKIVDVPPVYPETARQARIQGIVVVEITVGTDGAVTDARVLRSIPLLDAPALDAVRKWRYEPVLLNGRPVPVIMTATVPFNQ